MSVDLKELRSRMRPGQPLHDYVVYMLKRMRDFSWSKMDEQRRAWDDADNRFRAAIPLRDADKLREQQRDAGQMNYITIEIPLSYAILMAAHTYWTSVFLSRNPVLQFSGVSGQPEMQIQAVEAVMDYQVRVGRHLPNLYAWLFDVGKYGLGAMGMYWADDMIVVPQVTEEPLTYMGLGIGETQKVISRQVIPGYEGSKVFNIHPRDLVTDPRVPLSRAQDGEYMGWVADVGWNQIAKGAAADRLFNIDILAQRRMAGGLRNLPPESVPRPFTAEEQSWLQRQDMRGTRILTMCVELVPREWGIDDSTYPEKWYFQLANDEVIICAQPAGDWHNRFPVFLLEYEPDVHAMFNRGMLELMDPLQKVINWLVNTHFYSVRSALNGMYVADPTMIVMEDLNDPRPWKRIRLKPSAYGRDIKSFFQQVPTQDVTRAHLGDMQMVADWLQRLPGVNDNIMGMLNTGGGRRTATESRISSTFGVNRLKTNAEYYSATGWTDYAQTSLQLTQQRMSRTKKLRIAGDLAADPGAQGFVEVNPTDIQGFYDFVAVDGTMPVDRFAQVNLWTQLLGQIRTFPEIAQGYDMGRIFAWIGQLGGLRNIRQFKIQLTPDQQMQLKMQQGNVVPIGGRRGGAGGAGGGPGTQGAPAAVAGAAGMAGR